MKKAKFVFDTNALVSGLLLKSSTNAMAFDKARETGIILTSHSINKEIADVFLRKKFDKYVSFDKRLELLNMLSVELVLWPITSRTIVNVCRDAKDDKFLELAIFAQASCIVSGDKDLLTLHPYRGIHIINAADFLSMSF
ncbi:MAG: putative toxin-antitoxin system toxin component, PIN family [Chitinophagaceae bacterium]